MKWIDALRILNRDNPGKWCIPKTGTPEHQTVLDIMNGKHMRRQEKIQGSGLFDVFGKLYNMDKARKDKQKAGTAAFMKRADAIIAKQAEDAKKAEVPVVGSGKRRGRPKGSKNKVKKGGNIFKDIGKTLGKTVDVLNPFAHLGKELKKIKVS